MNENLITLLEELSKNEKLQEEIKGAKDLESLYAVTTKYVDGYTKEELKEGIKQIKEMSSSDDNSELSEDELESVAGGSKSIFRKIFNPITLSPIGSSLVENMPVTSITDEIK